MYKIKKKILYCIAFYCFSTVLTAQTNLSVKITPAKPVSKNELIRMGTNIRPNGTSIGINSQSLLVNNQPVMPVMGEIQYARVHENEYGGSWEHLMTLKTMAQEAGFDVPFYTRTGWPKLSTPATFGELIPLYGGYAEGFWDRDLSDMPGEDYKTYFVFRSFRNAVGIATEQLPPQLAIDDPSEAGYPELACELGGGMISSYHRRVNIAPMDNYSLALVQLGSGGNLPGYYVYHGGTHPDGELTTLNECQNSLTTNYNDLPVKSYDFQAPLGEFGQVNEHYHLLRRMHLFLRDFGGELTRMNAFFPYDAIYPDNANLLRWSVRSDGYSGYVFVNNYHRLKEMPAKENISLSMELPYERLALPPVTVAANSCFFIPFNMKLNGVLMKYATAQPVAKILQGNELTIKILPLKKEAPVHISKEYIPDFNNAGYALSLPKVEIYEKRSITLTEQ